ncbi:MAG: hypothetical protein AMJ66_10315 [Betaproteobacteria bacterium SG8_40]|nr:MAG: hypothetical protein AMJ66_10315 [Betaproteobacteria bacterium SG8_40]
MRRTRGGRFDAARAGAKRNTGQNAGRATCSNTSKKAIGRMCRMASLHVAKDAVGQTITARPDCGLLSCA